MSGERKAVGPVRKELQGFRVLHQSLEAERCNSLLSDDPTVSSPGSLVCRLASVVSTSSSRSSRIRRPPRLSLVSPTRIRGALSTRSSIPSAPPGSPRQDPRTTLLFPTLPGKHILFAPGFLCIIFRTCEWPRRALWCSSRGMAILSVAHGGTTSHVSCITFGRPLEQTRTICA